MPKTKTLEELKKEGLVKFGNDETLLTKWIPIGIPSLDSFLGEGIPLGKATMIYGEESIGKTLLAQYIAKAIQRLSKRPQVLYMDLENSFDKVWWDQTGVDTEKLLVSSPAIAEDAIDIIVSMLENSSELGLVIVDSIAAMIPGMEYDEERSASQMTVGQRAKLVTLLYSKVIPRLRKDNEICFLTINQMRENIGGHNELAALPGGRAQRHFSHIILKMRRDEWITNSSGDREGFYMEIISRKNKLAKTADGTAVSLPFMFDSQIDFTTSYIQDGIKSGYIVRRGPYYDVVGNKFLGMSNLRNFFIEEPSEMEALKQNIGAL